MKAATPPDPPPELSASFDALFTHKPVALSTNASIYRPNPLPKIDKLRNASRQAQSLAQACRYIQTKHAPDLTPAEATALQITIAAEIAAGIFRPEWFATATQQLDQCVSHDVFMVPDADRIPPCGLDPSRKPTRISFVGSSAPYTTPAPNTPGYYGSPGSMSRAQGGYWRDETSIIRRRRFLLPFNAETPGTRAFFARLSIDWKAVASCVDPAELASASTDWLRWSVFAHAGIAAKPEFWPYAARSQPSPPLTSAPPAKPAPANPFTWEASRQFTIDLTAHNLISWLPTARYFWVLTWLRRTDGIACPPVDNFDARFSDNLILYQLR